MSTRYHGVQGGQWQPVLPDAEFQVQAAPEPEIRAGFLGRLYSFRTLGRNPYLLHWAQDLDVPEEGPYAGGEVSRPVRLPFRPFGRNPYLWNRSVEGPPQVDDTGGSMLVVPVWDGFRLARASGFLYRGTAQDFDAPPPAEPDTLAQFLVRVPFKGLGRQPYLWHGAFESAPAPQVEEPTLAQFLVRLPYRAYPWGRQAQGLTLAFPQDEDAPPIIIPEGGDYIITFRRRRR